MQRREVGAEEMVRAVRAWRFPLTRILDHDGVCGTLPPEKIVAAASKRIAQRLRRSCAGGGWTSFVPSWNGATTWTRDRSAPRAKPLRGRWPAAAPLTVTHSMRRSYRCAGTGRRLRPVECPIFIHSRNPHHR
jgi:hypothetical protein